MLHRGTLCTDIVCWCNLSVCGFKMILSSDTKNLSICNKNHSVMFQSHISTVASVLHKPNCLFQEESSFHTAMLPEISEIWIFLLACKHQLKIYFSTTSFNNKGDHNIKMNMCNKQLKAKIEN